MTWQKGGDANTHLDLMMAGNPHLIKETGMADHGEAFVWPPLYKWPTLVQQQLHHFRYGFFLLLYDNLYWNHTDSSATSQWTWWSK